MKTMSKLITGAGVLAMATMGIITPALAATQSITVNNASLEGAKTIPSSFTATVNNVPAGTNEVTFVLDGVYLGKDKTAPFTWNVSTTAGEHKLKARSEGGTKTISDAEFTVVKAGAAPVAPKPVPAPAPAPVAPKPTVPAPVAPAPTPTGGKTVTNAAQLKDALAKSPAGSVINVADGVYTGDFIASASGKAGSPITLKGSPKAVLTTGSVDKGYGLHVTGDYWNISGISVNNSGKGIVLDDSDYTSIDRVDVSNTGMEGVHFRTGSVNGKITNSTIHDTGKKTPAYGEGVYVGSAKSNWKSIMGSASTIDASDNVVIQNNKIYNTTSEGIDIKEGTTNGLVTGNVFTNAGTSGENYSDSWVDVKGNNYVINNNSGSGTKLDAFQVHQPMSGWGNNNKFSANTVLGGVPGYLVNVEKGITGTTIACQPTTAKMGLSNIACK